jgi:hypothetical protein
MNNSITNTHHIIFPHEMNPMNKGVYQTRIISLKSYTDLLLAQKPPSQLDLSKDLRTAPLGNLNYNVRARISTTSKNKLIYEATEDKTALNALFGR